MDANGIVAKIDYNRAGQPTRVRRAVGTPNERTTLYRHNPQGDLEWFDPPGGSAGRVRFEYCRYDPPFWPGQPPQKAEPEIYVGQVTRILHPDGTSEYFGYNGADEAAWSIGRDGELTTLERDALHRVFRVNLGDTPGYPGFSVETQWDVLFHSDWIGSSRYLTDGTGLNTPITRVDRDDLREVVSGMAASSVRPAVRSRIPWTATCILMGRDTRPD